MSDGDDQQDPTGLNYLAHWDFAYSPERPELAVMEVAFSPTLEEAAAAVFGSATPVIKLVIDDVQAQALAEDFTRLATVLRAAKEADGKTKN